MDTVGALPATTTETGATATATRVSTSGTTRRHGHCRPRTRGRQGREADVAQYFRVVAAAAVIGRGEIGGYGRASPLGWDMVGRPRRVGVPLPDQKPLSNSHKRWARGAPSTCHCRHQPPPLNKAGSDHHDQRPPLPAPPVATASRHRRPPQCRGPHGHHSPHPLAATCRCWPTSLAATTSQYPARAASSRRQ